MTEEEKTDVSENTDQPQETGIDAEITEAMQESEESAPSEKAEDQPEETEEIQEEEKDTGWQKRIDKRTADYYREKRERERLEQENAELRKNVTPQTTSKPNLEQFDYDEDKYQEALIEWRIENKIGEKLSSQKQNDEENKLRKQADDFARKVAQANIPGYDEVVYNLAENVRLPMDVLTAINQDDKGPEILFYLGKNLDIADDLSRSDLITAGKKLAEISQKVAAPVRKKTTKAPEPVKPAGSGGGGREKSIDDYSMDDIMSDPNL